MWVKKDNKLNQNFSFANYLEALQFVNIISTGVEKLGHHSEIIFTWGRVSISTTTHDTGNIVTAKDLELAQYIEECYKNYTEIKSV